MLASWGALEKRPFGEADPFQAPGADRAATLPSMRVPRLATAAAQEPEPTVSAVFPKLVGLHALLDASRSPEHQAVPHTGELDFGADPSLPPARWCPAEFIDASEHAHDLSKAFGRLLPCGGAVWLPPGRSYRVPSPPLLIPANTLVLGGGDSSRIYTDHESFEGPLLRILNEPAVAPDSALVTPPRPVTLRRFLVDGTRPSHAAGWPRRRDGIHVPGVSQPVRLSNVTIRGCRGSGLLLEGAEARQAATTEAATRSGRVFLDCCTVEGCGNGILLSGGASAVIIDCRIVNAEFVGLGAIPGNAGKGARGTEVTRTSILGCKGPGIDLDGAVGLLARDCTIGANGSSPPVLFPPLQRSAQVVIRNSEGVTLLESSMALGNPPRSAPIGIWIVDSRGVSVMWNAIESHLAHDVLVSGASTFVTVIGGGRREAPDGIAIERGTAGPARRSLTRRHLLREPA